MEDIVKGSILLYAALLTGCTISGKGQPAQETTNIQTVYITASTDRAFLTELSQDADKITELNLPKKGFRIIAPPIGNETAIQVCAMNDKRPIVDITLNKNTCFTPGSGMAMPETSPPSYYIPLIISDGTSHNYYSSDRRVLDDTKITININEIMPLHGATLAETYLMIYVDKNKDRVINIGELWFAKVNWQ